MGLSYWMGCFSVLSIKLLWFMCEVAVVQSGDGITSELSRDATIQGFLGLICKSAAKCIQHKRAGSHHFCLSTASLTAVVASPGLTSSGRMRRDWDHGVSWCDGQWASPSNKKCSQLKRWENWSMLLCFNYSMHESALCWIWFSKHALRVYRKEEVLSPEWTTQSKTWPKSQVPLSGRLLEKCSVQCNIKGGR